MSGFSFRVDNSPFDQQQAEVLNQLLASLARPDDLAQRLSGRLADAAAGGHSAPPPVAAAAAVGRPQRDRARRDGSFRLPDRQRPAAGGRDEKATGREGFRGHAILHERVPHEQPQEGQAASDRGQHVRRRRPAGQGGAVPRIRARQAGPAAGRRAVLRALAGRSALRSILQDRQGFRRPAGGARREADPPAGRLRRRFRRAGQGLDGRRARRPLSGPGTVAGHNGGGRRRRRRTDRRRCRPARMR